MATDCASFLPIKTNATDCASLETIRALRYIKIRSALVAYNLGAHHQEFSHSLSVGYIFCVRHGYKGTRGVHKLCTSRVSLVGLVAFTRGVHKLCTPRVSLVVVAYIYFVRLRY
jgi:hypothetical protein